MLSLENTVSLGKAVAGSGGGSNVAVDNETIIQNPDSTITTIAVKEQHASAAIKQWVGTKQQFDSIVSKDPDTLYIITDDNGGGAIATLTWFNDTLGNTLDISSLSGTVSSVFKNGKLLKQGFTTDNVKYYSVTSSSESLIINKSLDWGTADTLAIVFDLITPNSFSDERIFSCTGADKTTPVLGISTTGKPVCWLSSNGSSWNIADGVESNQSLATSTKYQGLFSFDGSSYSVYFRKKETGATFEKYISITSSSKLYYDSSVSRLSLLATYVGNHADGFNATAKMSINGFKVLLDGQVSFDGTTATEGTDWTENCADTTISEPSDFNAFNIENDEITFSEPLLLDQIAVETY